MGIFHILHKGVLFLAQHVLVHQAGMPQHIRRELLHTVDGVPCMQQCVYLLASHILGHTEWSTLTWRQLAQLSVLLKIEDERSTYLQTLHQPCRATAKSLLCILIGSLPCLGHNPGNFRGYAPPQASERRSMLRRLARRSPRMPSRASRSSDMGSMPFWLITTKPCPSLHTCSKNQKPHPCLSHAKIREAEIARVNFTVGSTLLQWTRC